MNQQTVSNPGGRIKSFSPFASAKTLILSVPAANAQSHRHLISYCALLCALVLGILLQSPVEAQVNSSCTDTNWTKVNFTFDNVVEWTGTTGTPTGPALQSGMVIGPDTADAGSVNAAPQDTDPGADNYQPFLELGVTIFIRDPGGSCPSQTVSGADYGVGLLLNSNQASGTGQSGDQRPVEPEFYLSRRIRRRITRFREPEQLRPQSHNRTKRRRCHQPPDRARTDTRRRFWSLLF